MQRLYVDMLNRQLKAERQMIFLSGPRQVGKTTVAKLIAEQWKLSHFWNWDNTQDREVIMGGVSAITQSADLSSPSNDPTLLIFDELHKFRGWKDFLKGLFDATEDRARILVTGSARLDVFRRGGDSLMGRYFPWRMHPLSIGELSDPHLPQPPENLLREPANIERQHLANLLHFGGFPEPFIKESDSFSRRWKNLRTQQLFNEDLRDLTRIQDLGQVEHLAEVLRHCAGQLTSYTTLSKHVRSSIKTVSSWLQTLESFYYCFPVRPYYKNIPRSLRKEPKYYLWDWSSVPEKGQRNENFIACMLNKSMQIWTDLGFGNFELRFIRDKEGNEVDFVITKNDEAWFIVEVKTNSKKLSPSLSRFQKATGAKHAFQLCMDKQPSSEEKYSPINIFNYHEPIVIPAMSLLSRLL